MREELIQYLWATGVFNGRTFITEQGKEITILDSGRMNHAVGPDFMLGRVLYSGMEWVGHIEIHTELKFWYAHNHHLDAVYNQVVLHVVCGNAGVTRTFSGTEVPCISLQPYLVEDAIQTFLLQWKKESWPRCASVSPAIRYALWKELVPDLMRQRLNEKSLQWEKWRKENGGDWQRALFVALASTLGGPANADPFIRVATMIDLGRLLRYRRDAERIEALLFGAAGWLEGPAQDSYMAMLQREFSGLASLLNGNRVNSSAWQHGKVRPGARPERRLAVLVSLLTYPEGIGKLMDLRSGVKELLQRLALDLPSYWQTHYAFGKSSSQGWESTIPVSLRRHLIINVAVPFAFSYGLATKQPEIMAFAMDALLELPPEKNQYYRAFNYAGWKAENAGQTQAMIQLGRKFCSEKKCLLCAVGNQWAISQRLIKNED